MAAVVDVQLPGGRMAAAVAAGGYHTCAVLTDRTAICWGWNFYGELGRDSTAAVCGSGGGGCMSGLATIFLGAGAAVVAIAAGYGHTCAIVASGVTKCWGWNFEGRLGIGSTADQGDSAGEMAALGAVTLPGGAVCGQARRRAECVE